MIKKVERMAMLFDFYGKLLTHKQQEVLSLYYDQDLSLSEIAEEYKVSRQAVHDIIKRGEKILEGYEEKLGLVKKFIAEREKLKKILTLLDSAQNARELKHMIREIIDEIEAIQHN